MLLFRSEDTVRQWCAAEGISIRPLVSLEQLGFLAQTWYGNRLTVDSRRPAADEMVAIFARIGVAGPFWDPKADQWGIGD
jgi:hypothetical protein